MSLRVTGLILSGTVLLSACNQPPPPNPIPNGPPPTLVQVSSIVNVVKCELNYTFKQYPRLLPLITEKGKPPKISGVLHLQDVVVNTDAATAGLDIKVLNDSGLSGAYTKKDTGTQTADIKFDLEIDPRKPAPAQCVGGPEAIGIVGHPFAALLNGIGAEYLKIDVGSPAIQLGELDYTSQFDVERDASGGLKLDFVIFNIQGTHERDLTTTQSLELDFKLSGFNPRLMSQ